MKAKYGNAAGYYAYKKAKSARNAKTVTIYPKVTKPYVPRLKSEWKSIDATISQVQDTTGAVTLINGCAQGDDINNREGRQIQMRSVELKLLTQGTAATGIDQTHRILLVLDKMPSGAAPVITDILANADVNGMRNLNNRKRFKIIMDKRITINATGEAGTHKVIKKYKPFNWLVQFNANNNNTITAIQNNAVFLVTIGSVAAGATAGSTTGYSRIRFTE